MFHCQHSIPCLRENGSYRQCVCQPKSIQPWTGAQTGEDGGHWWHPKSQPGSVPKAQWHAYIGCEQYFQRFCLSNQRKLRMNRHFRFYWYQIGWRRRWISKNWVKLCNCSSSKISSNNNNREELQLPQPQRDPSGALTRQLKVARHNSVHLNLQLSSLLIHWN